MNKIELNDIAERIFETVKGHKPNYMVTRDWVIMKDIEEELKEFQRMVGLWVTKHQH